MSDTTEIESLPESEQGPSTGKDVTRKVSALDVYNLGARDQAAAGNRPSYPHRLRSGELTRAPLMYQSGNVTKLEGFEEYGATLGPVVSALEAMEAAVTEVIAARNKSVKDPTLVGEPAQVLKVAAYSDKLSEAATKKADVAHRHLASQIESVEADLTKAVTANIHTALAGEIRSHSKAQKSPMQFVSGLIAAGDEQSVNAVLGAPSYLSGLTDEMRAALTKQWNAKKNPALTARLELLKAADERLSRAGSSFVLTIEKAMGVDYRVVQKLREAQKAASFG